MNIQLRASTSLFPECIEKRLDGPRSVSGRGIKEGDLLLLPAIEPNHNLVTATTEVSRALARMGTSGFSEEIQGVS